MPFCATRYIPFAGCDHATAQKTCPDRLRIRPRRRPSTAGTFQRLGELSASALSFARARLEHGPSTALPMVPCTCAPLVSLRHLKHLRHRSQAPSDQFSAARRPCRFSYDRHSTARVTCPYQGWADTVRPISRSAQSPPVRVLSRGRMYKLPSTRLCRPSVVWHRLPHRLPVRASAPLTVELFTVVFPRTPDWWSGARCRHRRSSPPWPGYTPHVRVLVPWDGSAIFDRSGLWPRAARGSEVCHRRPRSAGADEVEPWDYCGTSPLLLHGAPLALGGHLSMHPALRGKARRWSAGDAAP